LLDISGLVDGPLVTLELVLFLLIGAPSLDRTDNGILRQDKPGKKKNDKHRNEA